MATCLEQINDPHLRVYDPSPKHTAGGWGSPMDLLPAQAQAVLITAIPGTTPPTCGTNLWAYHGEKVYRFMCDNVANAAWHGYPTGEKPPNQVLQAWRRSGLLSNAAYGKMLARPNRGS